MDRDCAIILWYQKVRVVGQNAKPIGRILHVNFHGGDINILQISKACHGVFGIDTSCAAMPEDSDAVLALRISHKIQGLLWYTLND